MREEKRLENKFSDERIGSEVESEGDAMGKEQKGSLPGLLTRTANPVKVARSWIPKS